ncbi:Ribosome biogenesis protein MAK21 [Rhodotorula toruloides]|uniref:CBF/Mak21 family-domain containing protein n=1 Tax=Rhodotorula toruloides TaxID=5286 RepID=A0A2T0AGQ8_RHOTO|nr:Ribosome biogenesis protein MAK21 [Rhodotorula toruloides]PRQ77182.1 CBF/Mak21 family-domain containing protein [Rhodotorula toruloides]
MAPPNPYIKALAPSVGGSKSAASPKRKNGDKKDKRGGGSTEGKGKGRAVDSVLREEILALGGDEADLEMLEDVESGSEVEGDEEGEAGLLKDLKSFVKGLDFKAAGAAAPASDSEDEAAQDDEEDEESDEEDERETAEETIEEPVVEEKKQEENVEPAPAKKESKVEREARRRAEREAAKAEEALKKEEDKLAKEEKRAAKLHGGKSPWIVDPTPQWYAVPIVAPSASAPRPKPELVTILLERGRALLQKENDLYSSSLDPKAAKSSAPPPPTGLSKADQVFIQQILSSGTSSDRISALLLLVSSSPLHTTTYLDQLAALCRKKSRDESLRAMRGVVDWWSGEGGGSPTRKLRYFADQPALATVAAAYEALEKKGKYAVTEYGGLTKEDVERCLVLFTFEDWFKRWFFQILQALEQMSVDPLPHPRTQAVMHLSSLLRDKPEQESNILRLLVNKLGDTNRGIASKTSHHLLQVLQTHPGMTPILVREVAALVLRPRTSAIAAGTPAASSSHMRFDDDEDKAKQKKAAAAAAVKDHARDNARYYGVVTLNQVMLKKDQAEVAGKMVDVYFEVFSDVLGRLPDKDDEREGSADEGDKPAKGKKRSRGGDVKGKKGGKKGGDENGREDAVDDVDSKLVAAVLTGINRAFPFAKIDDDLLKKRLDTLFRITHTSTFNVSIQALLLIFRVASAKKDILERFYRALYASMHDPRLANSSKQALYLNLLFRATKQDQDVNRVAAFVKRLIQILCGMDTTFVLGGLFIVGELMATVAGLRTLITIPEKTKLAAVSEAQAQLPEAERDSHALDSYDGRKREPKFAHAENSCLWELTPLLTHWHPTVVQYASAVLSGEPISATSDLEQYSLAAFLDRLVYREAKKSASSKGSSMMQPGLAGQDSTNRVVLVKGAHKASKAEVPVNSEQFRKRNVHDVPADQVFFHKFFSSKAALDGDKAAAATKRKSRKSRDSDDEEAEGSDAESIADAGGDIDGAGFDEDEMMAAMGDNAEDDEAETDEEMEEEIWKAMRKSMPKAKGDSDLDDLLDEEASGVDMDDDDDLAQYDYTDSEDEGAEGEAGAADDEEGEWKSAFPDEDEGDDGSDGFVEADDDLLGSDEDIMLGGGSDEDEEDEEEKARSKKSSKKRKVKHLPTFASAEDYAHLLGDSDDDA